MKYRVVWRTDLANRLEQHVFMAHETGRDAVAITAAVERVNLALSDAPATVGESRTGSERVLIEPPLSVVYEHFDDAEVVMVYEAVIHPARRV